MKKIFLILVIVFSPLLGLKAQYMIGDVKISSFQEVFNSENRSLWHQEREPGLFEFKVKKSDLWSKKGYSRLLIKKDGKSSATFMAKGDKKSDWSKEVLKPMQEQFGEYQVVTAEDPFVIGNSQTQLKKWTYNKDGKSYEILFGEMGGSTGILIYELKNK